VSRVKFFENTTAVVWLSTPLNKLIINGYGAE
jgi:hypothetical protein